MNRLGIENLSTFGLHPVEFIRLAGELACGHVSLNLSGSANRLDIYPEVSWREDVALQRDMARAAGDAGIAISLVEGFAIMPGTTTDFSADLDRVAAMGAKAFASERLPQGIETALQVHGGIAFTYEYDLHLYLRRARMLAMQYGDPSTLNRVLGEDAVKASAPL